MQQIRDARKDKPNDKKREISAVGTGAAAVPPVVEATAAEEISQGGNSNNTNNTSGSGFAFGSGAYNNAKRTNRSGQSS